MKARINFGWLPQIPDIRDIPYMSTRGLLAMPPRVNLPEQFDMPAAYDQGELGSCVANAIAAAIQFEQYKRHRVDKKVTFLEADREFTPSRLFIYYHARELLGTIHEDSGAMIRDGMKAVYNIGAPRETGWKYDISKFTQKPPMRQYVSAPFHKITGYRAIPVSTSAVKAALAENRTVVVGVSVFSSFFNADDTGVVPMPSTREQMLGGHAILLTGYDDSKQRFNFLNSWGAGWGDRGYGTIPYAYIGNRYLGGDYWTLIDEEYKERMTDGN